MAEMKKEYAVMAQHKYQQADNGWINVRASLEGPGKRFYHTVEEAKAALNQYVSTWNKEYVYDSKGKRIETCVCGGIGIDSVSDEKRDADMMVVAWKIKVREVTPWEELEEG